MGEECLKKGTMLKDRYRLEKVLGAGGFGITYLARDAELAQSMVIKEYYPRDIAGREREGRRIVFPREKNDRRCFLKGKRDFLLEARRLSQLFDIPEVVKVLDWFEENETAYLVMEYVRGISLDRYLQSQDVPLSFGEAWKLMKPLTEALERVHKKGIIHRDLNPGNLILQENGRLKIIDFGAARKYLHTEKTMTVLIKKGYAPPEQYLHKGKQGPWTDVYGFCAAFYEMITGVRPEPSVDRMRKDRLYLPSAYGAEILPEEEKILCRGLELEPEKRFRSMKALRQAVEPPEESPRKKKSFLRLLGISTAAFFCMISIIAFPAMSRENQQKKISSYAGSYGRQTEKYEAFLEFIKERAVSAEEKEEDSVYSRGKSTVYTLEPEDAQEWGEPCNQLRFDKKGKDFLKWMEEKGYSLEKTGENETAEAEVFQYGAVITDFAISEMYETGDGIRLVIKKDSINGDLFNIDYQTEEERIQEIKEMMADTAEFLAQNPAFDRESALKKVDELENRTQEDGWMDGSYNYWMAVLEEEELQVWEFGPNKRILGFPWYYWP